MFNYGRKTKERNANKAVTQRFTSADEEEAYCRSRLAIYYFEVNRIESALEECSIALKKLKMPHYDRFQIHRIPSLLSMFISARYGSAFYHQYRNKKRKGGISLKIRKKSVVLSESAIFSKRGSTGFTTHKHSPVTLQTYVCEACRASEAFEHPQGQPLGKFDQPVGATTSRSYS